MKLKMHPRWWPGAVYLCVHARLTSRCVYVFNVYLCVLTPDEHVCFAASDMCICVCMNLGESLLRRHGSEYMRVCIGHHLNVPLILNFTPLTCTLETSLTHCWKPLTHTTENLSRTHFWKPLKHTHYWKPLTHTARNLSSTLLKPPHTHTTKNLSQTMLKKLVSLLE